MLTNPLQLIAVLKDTGLVTDQSLINLLGKDHQTPTLPVLENALVSMNVVSREKLRSVKKAAFGVDVFQPTLHTPVAEARFPQGVLQLPRNVSSSLGLVLLTPDAAEPQVPLFAAVESVPITEDTTHESWVRKFTSDNFRLILITAPDFKDAFMQVYDDSEVKVEKPPPDILTLLTQTIDDGASDIHLTVGQPPTLRVDGTLRRNRSSAVSADWMQDAVFQLGGKPALDAVTERYEYDFAFQYGLVRFRVTVGRDRNGLNLVARRLPPDVPRMVDLGLPAVVREFVNIERGLVLVTGPTGSGKSTTLASLIGDIARHQPRHIVTLEDPIEYVLPTDGRATVNQRELGSDVTSFAAGLRQALRQDPDVIFVGELRDAETIRTALLAAETGHLVFATTHTTTAEGSIQRLLSAYSPEEQEAVRNQVAMSLRGIVGQMLIPKASGRGRIACFEVLINTPSVASNLRRVDGMPTVKQLLETSSEDGMQTMDQGLAELVRKGHISEEEGVMRARDREGFYRALKRSSR